MLEQRLTGVDPVRLTVCVLALVGLAACNSDVPADAHLEAADDAVAVVQHDIKSNTWRLMAFDLNYIPHSGGRPTGEAAPNP